jgi:hypothetical protein
VCEAQAEGSDFDGKTGREVTDIAAETLTPKTLAGLQVQRVQERSAFLNMLIYGDSGVGKTTLAGSADALPSMRPVLFIDIEGGTESLRRTYPDVEEVRVTTWKEMQEVYSVLYDGKHEYRTVVLDSLTEIQKFSMYQIMFDLVQRKEEADPDIPSVREWGKNIEQVRRFVRGFRDLQMHTIFTALVKSDKDAKTGIVTMKPYLSGKLADEIAGFLDIVVYYYVKALPLAESGESENRRLLLTQKTEQQIAKDRSGLLPLVVEEPTMTKLFELMNPRPGQTPLVAPEPKTSKVKKTETETNSEPEKVGT